MSAAQRAVGGLPRDLDILEALAQSTAHAGVGLRLTDLAAVTGREKSQLSRGLARLEEAGLVARDETDRRFLLGWRLFHYAALTAEAHLVSLAQPAMRRIVAQLDETVHLCVLRGTSCVTLHSEVPRHGFRLSWVGAEAPAHTITAGRVLLAELSDDELKEVYPSGRLPGTPPTGRIRTRPQLLAECAAIRGRGYALVDEEFETGLVGASAAVHDFRGIAVASLNIAAPKPRLEGKLEAAGEYIARAAQRLSAGLGSLPHPSA
jgi:DNA-binding IclR family transcriptional regulator